MMDAKVDVLQVLRDVRAHLDGDKFMSEVDLYQSTIEATGAIEAERARYAELVAKAGVLADLCPTSVEYSDWPELQAAVDDVNDALAALGPQS